MNRIILIFISSILVFFSCEEKKKNIEYEFYNSGEIKKKIVYNNPKDSGSYKGYVYYKNGKISHQTTFKNGKRTGNYYTYYENGKIKKNFFYKRGNLHGVQKEYIHTGELKGEAFYINGKNILLKKYSKNQEDSLYRAICYMTKYETLHEIGRYIYDYNNEIKKERSFYYKVYGKDTIKINDTTNYRIEFFNKRDDFLFKLQIGKLNKDLSFAKPSEIRVFKTYKNSIVYTFAPNKTGNQLLMGKINLVKDTVNLEFPLYKEYYVKK
jgi:hypothetical protein